MEIILIELKWLHLGSLIVLLGMSFSFGVVARVAATKSGNGAEAIWAICDRLEKPINISAALVFTSGPLLMWLKYGSAGLTTLFWIKMALVAALLVNLVIGLGAVKRVRAGDTAALGAMNRFSILEVLIALAIVMAAVFTFN